MTNNPSNILALADKCAADGALLDALKYYNEAIEGEIGQKWYAFYQAARMLDELDFNTQLVIEAYFRAYDYRPGNIEPLIRIAGHCRRAGKLQTALELIDIALETEPPERDSHEPDAWSVQLGLEHLRICLTMSDDIQATGIADQLLCSDQLSVADRKLVRILRLQASDIAKARMEVGLPAQEIVALQVESIESDSPEQLSNVPEETPQRGKCKLCIGMATYDDYDGVYFSVQAIRMYHPEILDEIEILVVDNNPMGAAAEKLKELDSIIPNYRYVPESSVVGSSASRNRIFCEANADYVLVIDCHVFIVPGALARLVAYFDANSSTSDLLQGPLVHDDLETISTHFTPGWQDGMWGIWETDVRGENIDGPAFDIPMQGCGLFAARKAAWPCFNSQFAGFGGEEGYIHEKVRQAGGRTLCLPFLRWMHRFNRPLGIPYPTVWEARIRNYIIGWQELGLDIEPIRSHFTELIGPQETELAFEQVAREQSQA